MCHRQHFQRRLQTAFANTASPTVVHSSVSTSFNRNSSVTCTVHRATRWSIPPISLKARHKLKQSVKVSQHLRQCQGHASSSNCSQPTESGPCCDNTADQFHNRCVFSDRLGISLQINFSTSALNCPSNAVGV